MSIPIETIFAMLAIEMFRALARPEDLRPPSVGVVLAATAAWIACQYVLASSLARRTQRRLRRASGASSEIVEDFRFRLIVNRTVLVVLCLAHVYFTRWPMFVEEKLGLPSWSVLDDVAAIAPFVAAMAAGWIATYRADQMLSRRPWGIAEYVWFQARYSLLLVLLPWLVLKAIDDSQELWPKRVSEFFDNTAVSVGVFAVLIALAAVFLPLFLKWLFRAVPMPPSDIRTRLEKLAERAGLRFRDVLVWRMARARILNAGVMGIVPRFRYVLFSDALLDSLSPAECEAVLGHEIGHTKHRHVLVYLVFTLGFVALAYNFMSLLPPGFRAGLFFRADPSGFLVVMPVLAILVGVYFRLIFGVLSRAFEREADVYAAALLGTPVPLILALEKIALMSGDVRRLSSWRHHSVAERVRCLSSAGYDPSERERHHRHARTLVRGVIGMVAVLFAVALCVSLREPEGLSAKIAFYEEMTARKPWDDYPWIRLGEVRADYGDGAGALQAFAKALECGPPGMRRGRARAGLLRLKVRASTAEDEALASEAAGLVEKLTSRDGERAAGLLLAAELHMNRAFKDFYDPERAAGSALEALAIERSHGEVRASTYEAVGRALLVKGDARAAAEHAEKGLARYPDSGSLEELGEAIRGSQ